MAQCHMTKAPATITYENVVSKKTVRIELIVTTINDHEVKLADILNAYIHAPVTEKVWTVLGHVFSKDVGKITVTV